ncbi:RnfABCDGE type electron transport complex subunit B [Halodesulfovibrio sp.]|uniref:RnfABCDGE type electron transport complex subunit B n=1 Tax=Halodesulfovibrio sp. TaxID=1912772 RepID=UPI0025C4D6A1|nr:Fe-S cluster domain-containing protein [Halodesulfovibrio sp.]
MVLTSVLSLLALGFFCAVVLSAASRVFYVEEDPRVEAICEALPGANCGGCGYAGCEAYAIAVITDPDVSAGLCCAGGAEVSIAVAELSGKSAGSDDPEISFRRCVKDEGKVQKKFEYQGVMSCTAAGLLEDGADACKYSCLGYGDCVKACPFDAMYIENDLVVIDPDKCVACGACINVCPNQVLEMIPRRARVQVYCSTKDKMKAVMNVCEAGCINCMKCVKKCPAKAISHVDGQIRIDQAACLAYGPDCEEACVDACPRDILRLMCPVGISAKAQEAAAAKQAAEAAQAAEAEKPQTNA